MKKRFSKKRLTKKKRRQNKKRMSRVGGQRVWMYNGKLFFNNNEYFNGKDFFEKPTSPGGTENTIYGKLFGHMQPNIVSIYEVTGNSVKIEVLTTNILLKSDPNYFNIVKTKMREVKDYLQNNGIVYFDWKLDNIGIGSDGELKLFDFDCSGIINGGKLLNGKDLNGCWSYQQALRQLGNFTDPINIDDYLFEQCFAGFP